ncbi:acetolactate synthase [Sarocladium strictum]
MPPRLGRLSGAGRSAVSRNLIIGRVWTSAERVAILNRGTTRGHSQAAAASAEQSLAKTSISDLSNSSRIGHVHTPQPASQSQKPRVAENWKIVKERTGGDVVHNVLVNHEVDMLFGIPGRSQALDPFRNLYKSEAFKSFAPVQEQSVGHIAEGYARATGKPGIVIATSAHAIPSLVTPMQDALMDGTPMVVLYSLSPSSSAGFDEFQSPDNLSIAAACTKWTTKVRDISELQQKLHTAFEIAGSGRPGSVMVEIPPSILAGGLPMFPHPVVESPAPRYLKPTRIIRPHDTLEATLARVATMVDRAEKPILFVGQGMLASPNGPAVLKEFADRTNMPVTTTLQGMGAFDELDPKALHMMGLHGASYANRAIQEADLILALGARFDDRVTGALAKFAPGAKAAAQAGRGGIVHFEISPKNVDKVITATEAVIGDCTENLAQLTPLTQRCEDRPEWWAQINAWKKAFPLSAYKLVKQPVARIRPQDVIAKLSDMTAGIKDKVLMTTGVGQHQMWAAQHFRWRHPRTMLTSGGLGTMGYGLPAAIGAKLARPECLVIDVDGDASFGMTMMELATVAHYKVGVKILIFNNEEMGMISDLQRLYYSERFTANRPINPDFVGLADAYGVASDRAVTPEEVEEKLRWLIECNGPALLEVATEQNAPVWPVVPAGKGLHEGITYPAVRD